MSVEDSLLEFYSSPVGREALENAQRRTVEDAAALELIQRMKARPGSYPQAAYRCSVAGCLLLEAYLTPAGIACKLGAARISPSQAGRVKGGARGQEGRTLDARAFRLPTRGILVRREELKRAGQQEGPLFSTVSVVIACRHQWGQVPIAVIQEDAEQGMKTTKTRIFAPSVRTIS